MLPPIRYPLPTALALVIASLLIWRGEAWTRAWRLEVASRVGRAVNGPPVPRSSRPQVVAGPMIRRGLLLRDATPVLDRPRGSKTEIIDRRMFVDLYDEWPDAAKPSHYRVGNRSPIGWVAADSLLPWNTRLVVRPPSGRLILDGKEVQVGKVACPVLHWRSDAVELAIWSKEQPWETLGRRGWVRLADLPVDAWGVWISQVELPNLLRLALGGDSEVVRLRVMLGRIAAADPLTRNDVDLARPALPALVFAPETYRPSAVERLAEANARPQADARWSGLSFRFLPLTDLP